MFGVVGELWRPSGLKAISVLPEIRVVNKYEYRLFSGGGFWVLWPGGCLGTSPGVVVAVLRGWFGDIVGSNRVFV